MNFLHHASRSRNKAMEPLFLCFRHNHWKHDIGTNLQPEEASPLEWTSFVIWWFWSPISPTAGNYLSIHCCYLFLNHFWMMLLILASCIFVRPALGLCLHQVSSWPAPPSLLLYSQIDCFNISSFFFLHSNCLYTLSQPNCTTQQHSFRLIKTHFTLA